MKKILIFLLVVLTSGSCLHSQPCALPPGCADIEYPYFFCGESGTKGGKTQRCSKNPYNEKDANGLPLIPLKLDGCFEERSETYNYIADKTVTVKKIVVTHHNVPIDIYDNPDDPDDPDNGRNIYGYDDFGDPIFYPYDTSVEVEEDVDIPGNDDFYDASDLIFDFTHIQSAINAAKNAWTSICSGCTLNSSPQPQHCCVPILWTANREDFRSRGFNPSIIPAYSDHPIAVQAISACRYNCNDLRIVLNQTNDFTGATDKYPADYTNHFFFTDAATSDWYSLKAVLMHEMGHIFGFGDEYDTGIGAGCKHSGSIMDGEDFENADRGLSNDDICMYKKSYCPPPVSAVQEEPVSINSTFNIFPNPTTSSVTIALSPSAAQYGKHLRVLDMGGKIVLEQQFQAGSSDCTVSTTGFTAGSYLFIMTFDGINGSFAQKVIVQ